MRADNIGAFPVGENDRLIAMVTDRDIVVRAVAENRSAGNTTVQKKSSRADNPAPKDANLLDATLTPRTLELSIETTRLYADFSSQDLDRAADGGRLACASTLLAQRYPNQRDLSSKSKRRPTA
jgi:CBS domain-containing protein